MSTPPGIETRGPAILGTAIALPIFASLFVGARVYTRVRIINFFGIDDWVSIATLVVSIAYSVCLGIWSHHGGGIHTVDLTKEIEIEYYKWILIASEFYALALLGYKTAILLLYIRLFQINKTFIRACYAVMAFNAAYLLSNIILQIFSCTPVQKFYDKDLPGHCVSLIPPDITWGAMSMVSDLAIAILPIPIVWRLRLSRRDKILVSLVFLTGLIAFVMALVRWILAIIDLTAEDRIWIAGLTFLFSIVEVNTGIICGCTATLKPLIRFARDQSTRRKSSTTRRYEKRGLFHRHGGGGGDHHSSSVEESKSSPHHMRAPPATMDMSMTGTAIGTAGRNKSSDGQTESPTSTNESISAMSRATTAAARPSIADALPDDTNFSHDLLNLPREGTSLQPALKSDTQQQQQRHQNHSNQQQQQRSDHHPVHEAGSTSIHEVGSRQIYESDARPMYEAADDANWPLRASELDTTSAAREESRLPHEMV